MAEIVSVRVNWDNTAIPIKMPGQFYNLHIDPSTDNPFGEKGKSLSNAWRQLNWNNKMDGMLIIDGDVAIDEIDYANMLNAIHYHDKMVVIAPARIWPASTKRKNWSWAHWSKEPSQVLETENVRWFSFNFTYLPKKVIDQAHEDGLISWAYPNVDKNMSTAAFNAGVPVFVAEDVLPKHMNF